MQKLIPALVLSSLLSACTITLGGNAPQSSTKACGTEATPFEAIQAAKADSYESLRPANHIEIAHALINCIGNSDPKVRDDVVYETVTYMLRANWLDASDIKDLKFSLLKILKASHTKSFTAPYAALLLSEVARADRIYPILTDTERAEFVVHATDYLSSVSDYRGFSDRDGWRHGVAHGADWLMQLSVNPKITQVDATLIRDAIASQVTPEGHNYIFGEPERLSRPIIFLAASGRFTPQEWSKWLLDFTEPMPVSSWDEAYGSEEKLARLHDLRAFLNALYMSAERSNSIGAKDLLPGVTAALDKLP